MAIAKLKVGVAGLGKRYALHLLTRTPHAGLVVAFSSDETKLTWARSNLEPSGVKLYQNYDEKPVFEGRQVVCIATVTNVYAEETIKAINK